MFALDVILEGEVHLNRIVLSLHIGAVELSDVREYCTVLMSPRIITSLYTTETRDKLS